MRALVLVLVLAVAACGGAKTSSPSTTAPSTMPSPFRPLTAADLRPSANGSPPAVAPSRLEPLRVAGTINITPSDEVKAAAQQTGHTLRGTFKYCVDETGQVTNVTVLQTTQVEAYDAKIVREMQKWAYRPVVVDGHATAVCSAATFIFSVR